MGRNTIVAIAVLLATVVGVSGYMGVSSLLDRNPEKSNPNAERILKAETRMARMEARLARLETRPSLEEALSEVPTRQKLISLIAEARRRDREVQEKAQLSEREKRIVASYRESFDRLLKQAQVASSVPVARWEKLTPVFNVHFKPVQESIARTMSGDSSRWRWVKIDINREVSPGLATFLSGLKKVLTPEQMQRFDKWRLAPGLDRYQRMTRAEYFCSMDELSEVVSRTAVDRRWAVLSKAMPKLFQTLELEAGKRSKLEKVLKSHTERFTQAFNGQLYINVADANNLKVAVEVANNTDQAIKDLLDEEAFKKFDAWRCDPEQRVNFYFGKGVHSRKRHPAARKQDTMKQRPEEAKEKY